MADCIRTSLGPRGMDKMIRDGRGETLITNDGATILQKMEVVHPTAKMVPTLSFSLFKFPRLKMSRLGMEPPLWSSWPEPSSRPLSPCSIRESTPTSSLKVLALPFRIPEGP